MGKSSVVLDFSLPFLKCEKDEVAPYARSKYAVLSELPRMARNCSHQNVGDTVGHSSQSCDRPRTSWLGKHDPRFQAVTPFGCRISCNKKSLHIMEAKEDDAIGLSIPLPRSLGTRIYVRLSTKSRAIVLNLTTASQEELAAARPMGSFVYALPNVCQGQPLLGPSSLRFVAVAGLTDGDRNLTLTNHYQLHSSAWSPQ